MTNYFTMQEKRLRQVKVYGKYQRRLGHWNGGRDYSWLNVSGLWLEQAGFKIGDQLQICVENNKLIITNQPHGDQGH